MYLILGGCQELQLRWLRVRVQLDALNYKQKEVQIYWNNQTTEININVIEEKKPQYGSKAWDF